MVWPLGIGDKFVMVLKPSGKTCLPQLGSAGLARYLYSAPQLLHAPIHQSQHQQFALESDQGGAAFE
ncbi:MAG: hypothetical protein EA368_10945 [Leptolyngbya sp. DLM2.Bin27]|nr:MAG: hypothetical protein EA368_10945 [Leptolyngbya sp. DLM2.Bin27]